MADRPTDQVSDILDSQWLWKSSLEKSAAYLKQESKNQVSNTSDGYLEW